MQKDQVRIVYQTFNKLNKLFIETWEITHIQLFYQIILLYMFIYFGEDIIYNPENNRKVGLKILY